MRRRRRNWSIIAGIGVGVACAGVALSEGLGTEPEGAEVSAGLDEAARGGTPTGACCFFCTSGELTTCDVLTEAGCDQLLGRYMGDGLGCVEANCGCVGDLNADCRTDVFDFALLAVSFGTSANATRPMGDMDCDGDVDVFDFGLFAPDFGCIQGGCCFTTVPGDPVSQFRFTTREDCLEATFDAVFVEVPCGEFVPALLTNPPCCVAEIVTVQSLDDTECDPPTVRLRVVVESEFGISSVTVGFEGYFEEFQNCPTTVSVTTSGVDGCFVPGDLIVVEVQLCHNCPTVFLTVTVPGG